MVLVAITLGVYFQRGYVAYREKKKAPAPAPPSVERQSGEVTFSKVEKERTIFTVRAKRSTEFRGRDENLLEEVQITIFGQTGERHDTIHTTSCQYSKDSGKIDCSGEVQMDLQSAADAERGQDDPAPGPARTVHVVTRGVSFDRESGIAQTKQRVNFVFPSGRGEAIGARYQSAAGVLRLERDVRLTLRPPATPGSKTQGPAEESPKEVGVRGAALEFRRDSRTMRLLGPAEAETGAEHLNAGELALILDTAFHAQRLVASAGAGGQRPELRSQGSRGTSTLSADTLTAQFAPQGWVETIEAATSVQGFLHGAAEEDQLQADRMEMQLTPRVSTPRELMLEGNVSLQTSYPKTGEERQLETAKLHVVFSGGSANEASRPQRAETLSAGTLNWTERAATGGQATQTKLSADRLALNFGVEGRAQRLEASGNVQTERRIPGRPVQTAASDSGVAQLVASGGWSQMDLQGRVRLKEGDHTAQGEQATFHRAEQTAVLTGKALVRDASTETQAQRITFFQATGEIRAEGRVRSSDLSPQASTMHLAPQAAHLSAETLVANSQSGRALYTGHARLWQGDSVLEADSIELLRPARVLNANGNVRAIFPQAEFSAPTTTAGTNTVFASAKPPASKTALWHVQAQALTYRDAESRAHLEKNVVAVSETQRIRAAGLELNFSRSGGTGAQQLSRAIGTGGVTVEQGDRRGAAERGEYTAADGKFVLSGGTPTLYDALRGTTTGRQLTFFLADDTIIVDSENGSRTLTKHRVEK